MTFPGKMPDVSYRHGLQCSVYKYMLFVETNAFFFEIYVLYIHITKLGKIDHELTIIIQGIYIN